MELQLQYNTENRLRTRAAFLRGSSPEQWFREMSEWQIPLLPLSGYLLPEHKDSSQAAGMLIVFKNEVPEPEHIIHPYGAINDNLFIPVNAGITPALTPQETKDLLIWHVQVFHPGIGFVGFDERDKINLADLIYIPEPLGRSWEHAHPGLPPTAQLTRISITKAPGQELNDLLNGGMETLPLSEMPGAAPVQGPGSKIGTLIMKMLLMLLALLLELLTRLFGFIFRLFPRILPKASSEDISYVPGRYSGRTKVSASRAASGKASKRARVLKENSGLKKWLERKLKDLQQRRESELDRLVKMFDKNADEALKYAIPLVSNTAGRGPATPSDSLTQKQTNFNLGGLFGSGPTDSWEASEQQNMTLEQIYREQAEKAIARGDFRKAAYIYAHLLGDFEKAASVLVQGQFYHEAATLYKDHLKQPLKAALCLEKGGLLSEAIDIYKSLDMFEKTGDLYKQLSQHRAAEQYFRLAADVHLQKNDYIPAANILYKKCGNAHDAQEVLLRGWQESPHDKLCLESYLDITTSTDKERLAADIRRIYERETPTGKKNLLLDVLIARRNTMDDAAQQTALDITFDIVSAEMENGDNSRLSSLRLMLPDDKELPVDIMRYNKGNGGQNTKRPADPKTDNPNKFIVPTGNAPDKDEVCLVDNHNIMTIHKLSSK